MIQVAVVLDVNWKHEGIIWMGKNWERRSESKLWETSGLSLDKWQPV